MTPRPAEPWVQLNITQEEFEEKQRRVDSLSSGADIESAADEQHREDMTYTPPFEPDQARNHPISAPGRKPRSDIGVKRGPKAPGEPEAMANVETTSITVELTPIQYADLEREAARIYRDIEPRYLTEAPATVLLNSRVQKHWRTLVGK